MSIEQLRAEYERLGKEVDRIEGRQEAVKEELDRLEQEARDLEFTPDNLDNTIEQLLADASSALDEVRSGLAVLGVEAGIRA